MSRGQRDGVMIPSESGQAERLLVGHRGDHLRGLDLTGVSHVVDYDIPNYSPTSACAPALGARAGPGDGRAMIAVVAAEAAR